MFEVELKFILTPDEEIRLLEGATFIKREEFIDIYYEDKSYSLSTKDIWLRSRNGTFILKTPIETASASLKKQKNSPKNEIEDHQEILKFLKINHESGAFDKNLINNGIHPLYKFWNVRRKFSKAGFIIDLDKAVFEDFTYETCEIERVVDSQNDINDALIQIESFANTHGLHVSHVEGRLIEYIRRRNPDHYLKLS